MKQLQIRSPQMFQKIEQIKNNDGDPIKILKDITKEYTPEQIDGLFEQAKKFGVPDKTIQQVQNEIK